MTTDAIARAAACTVGGLFAGQARQFPERIAIQDGDRKLSYAALLERSRRLAGVLRDAGVERGSRVAILSENRSEYLELFLAAASQGAVVACQNWRLSPTEIEHCLTLVEPELVVVSPRFEHQLDAITRPLESLVLGSTYEQKLQRAQRLGPSEEVGPEDPLLILYTSGTTGLPKGAVISHRAEIYRNLVMRAEFGLETTDTFPAWSPLYHMGAVDPALGALMCGGKVVTIDGYDPASLIELIAKESLGWLLLMPGMVGGFIEELQRRNPVLKGVKLCGVMADLVPPHEIAMVTRLLDAPYANTFGATETGCPPCSSNLIPVGVAPDRLSKRQSPFCEIKLVDANDREVEDGSPGELCIRGPTLFSGYYRDDDANQEEFRGGWFHMGDVFVRNADGTLDFVDRVKYLIKSGGENIYPAEIERVLLQDRRVIDAAVVRRRDDKWGEVPVAFVARHDESLDEAALYQRCRAALAGYKQPKAIFFIAVEDFPRSTSGKIQRQQLEKRLLKA